MAEAIKQVREALDTMPDGDWEAVKQAVDAARFDRRADFENVTVDYDAGPGTFEMVVTPYVVRKKITREQWKELLGIWRSHPPAGEE